MNEQIIRLVEHLAMKLGVATEHLWGALIQQAYVDAVGSIIKLAIVSAITWVVYRVHIYLSVKVPVKKSGWPDIVRNRYESVEELKILMAFLGFVMVVFCVVAVLTVSSDLVQLLNPEYYAISKLLRAIR
jgi:Na+/proline symporter